jgi:hypothetical protein
MAFTRQNVWELGGDWADPILWYARGVKAMQVRARTIRRAGGSSARSTASIPACGSSLDF